MTAKGVAHSSSLLLQTQNMWEMNTFYYWNDISDLLDT